MEAEAEIRAEDFDQALDQGLTLSLHDGRAYAVVNKERIQYHQHTVTYHSAETFDMTLAAIRKAVYSGRRVVALQSTPFRFLDLSAELRNMIYTYVLSESFEFEITGYGRSSMDAREFRVTGHVPGIGLLATCRQVHKETAPLLYGSTRFAFREPTLFHDFLSRLPSYTKYVRKVLIIQPEWASAKKGLRLLTGVKHLECLRILTIITPSPEWYAKFLEEFLSTMQEKVNDREALCETITLGRAWTEDPGEGFKYADFRRAVFKYLKDKPELGAFKGAGSQGNLVSVRDTGSPKRDAVTKKAISYAEDD